MIMMIIIITIVIIDVYYFIIIEDDMIQTFGKAFYSGWNAIKYSVLIY